MPDNFIFIAFYFVLPKRTSPLVFHAAQEAHVRGVARTVFLNSLLATLNARGSLLGRKGRRRAQSKVAFRTPTVTAEPAATAGAMAAA